MRRLQPLAILLFFAVVVCGDASLAAKRVALVIGNSAYSHAGELANPKNDASDIATALRDLGLTVIEASDLTKSAMDTKLREFAAELTGADAGVFFFAGHGLQVNGTNYLVPIDAQLSTVSALEFEMVRLDIVQRVMEEASTTNILFLDACRNNPLSRNLARAMGQRAVGIGRGLAPVESGVGTLISFSTQPGNVALDGTGRNSPFAGPLAKAIKTPGEDIVSILIAVRNEVLATTDRQQVPWENHALTAKFYFNPGAPSVPTQPLTATLSSPSTGSSAALGPQERFQDCPQCPLMIAVPEGAFELSPGVGKSRVLVKHRFAIAQTEITYSQWEECVRDKACRPPSRAPSINELHNPVVNVDWFDAHAYTAWLSRRTNKAYRLPSEVEWQYAASSGSSWPDKVISSSMCDYANVADRTLQGDRLYSDIPKATCFDSSGARTLAAASFKPNPWGLFDIVGNAAEWVEDCKADLAVLVTLHGRPAGRGTSSDCSLRGVRGGSWKNSPQASLPTFRQFSYPTGKDNNVGFRIARDLH